MPSSEVNSVMEKEFTFKIDEENFKGRIDQINIIDNSTVEIIDFKSGANNISKADFEKEIQLKLYRLAIDLSENLSFLKYKNYQLKYIFLGEDKKPVLMLPEEYYNEKDFLNLLNEMILETKSEKYEPDPGSHLSCSGCSYKIICPKFSDK
jgi:RecB family exonuclease